MKNIRKDNLLKTEIVLGFGVLFVALEFYVQNYAEGKVTVIPEEFLTSSILFVTFTAIVLSIVLARYLWVTARQEKIMNLQRHYIDSLQEMMQVIKAQRHDFINHLQVVYGFLSLNESSQAQAYISNLYQDVQVSGRILQLAVPELAALLMVKMGVATTRDISFFIDIDSNLASLKVRALDLASIVGNLVNNALEATENMEIEQRIIELRIFDNSRYFIIQIINPGFIPREIKNEIFKPGFSTKTGSYERGVGLSSVKHLVEKNRGKIVFSSHPETGTRFSVCFPK